MTKYEIYNRYMKVTLLRQSAVVWGFLYITPVKVQMIKSNMYLIKHIVHK